MNTKESSSSFFILVVISFLQLGNYGECSLPRLPDSLSSRPEFNKYIVEQDRIVGGTAAETGQFPYQCSLQRVGSDNVSTRHFCGCSIVNDRYIVTAAHCYSPSGGTDKIRVLVGKNSIMGSSGKLYRMESCQRYAGYNSSTVEGDICMCRTAEKIVMSSLVQPVALPYAKEGVDHGAKLVVTGWGTTSEGGSVSQSLQKVTVPAVDDATCKKAYGETEIYASMLCAGESGRDSCQGDSGGPMAVDKNGVKTLVGVVSWGYGCARPDYPGVYTEVSHFIDFIKSTCESDASSSALNFVSIS